jgi:large subunit ribosomal protein L25
MKELTPDTKKISMKEVKLSGSVRTSVGKKASKAVRNKEEVPVVVYGGEKQHHLSVKHLDLYKLLYTPNAHIVNIDAEGTSIKAFVKDVHQHPVTERILHVDFVEILPNKKVTMEIPVKLIGRSPGVTSGGRMNQVFRKLPVRALLADLPDSIEVDISKMAIGDSVRVSSVSLNGVEILQPADAVICSVKVTRQAEETTAAPVEGAAAPAEGAAAGAAATPAAGGAAGAAKAEAAPAAKGGEKKDKK